MLPWCVSLLGDGDRHVIRVHIRPQQRRGSFQAAPGSAPSFPFSPLSAACIPRLLVLDFFPDSAVLPKLVVKSLDIHGLELVQLDNPSLERMWVAMNIL